MDNLFAVIRSQGARWNAARPMEEQEGWPAHAAFMNALHAEGFVVLGGPLAGTLDVLLVIRARDRHEIEARLSGDPWGEDVLSTARIARWTLRLGALGPEPASG